MTQLNLIESKPFYKGASGSHLMTHVWSRSTVAAKESVRRLIPTHPVNIPCGRKPGYPQKTHDFRQDLDWLFSFTIEPTMISLRYRSPSKGVSKTILVKYKQKSFVESWYIAATIWPQFKFSVYDSKQSNNVVCRYRFENVACKFRIKSKLNQHQAALSNI
jgi:hypothetical protein